MTDDASAFEAQRPRLFAHAYRMLGEAGAAEDVVQETWLRWSRRGPEPVREPAAWLTRATTRLAIDALRRAKARRESYVGPWLPEPLVEPFDERHAADESAERVELAFLVMLERLSPEERAALLLHDVFDAPYAEIARSLDKSEVACRKLVSRARERAREGRPRFPADEAAQKRLLDAFFAATLSGDREAMKALLTEDAVMLTDGGALGRAALRPLVGPEEVSQVVAHIAAKGAADGADIRPARVNGGFGYALVKGGAVDLIATCEVRDGRIAALYLMRNPEKLVRAASSLSPTAPRSSPSA